MSFFSDLKNKFTTGKDEVLRKIDQYRNSDFLEAVVGASVLIAAADGNISSEEKQKLLAYVSQAEELKSFSTNDVINIFKKITDSYEFDANVGKGEALKRVARVKGKDEQAKLIIYVAIAIANSDGNFDESEKAVVRLLCSELNISPADFDC